MNHDEKPVGGHRPTPTPLTDRPNVPDQPQEQQKAEPANAPLEQRLLSKVWKIRLEAYTELSEKFSASEPSSEVFVQQAHAFAKYVADPHPVAQSRALAALGTFLARGAQVPLTHLGDLVVTLLDKCVSSARGNIRDKAVEVILSLKNSSVGTVVVQSLVDSVESSKSSKTTVAGVQVLAAIIGKSGPAALDIKGVFQAVEKLALVSTNPAVRSEVIRFYKEAHKVLQDEILPFLANLKPLQQEELKRQFAEPQDLNSGRERMVDSPCIPGGETQVCETRCETEARQEELKINSARTPTILSDKKKLIDPGNCTFLTNPTTPAAVATAPTDNEFLAKFNETWCASLLALKKWSEKKDRLDELSAACTTQTMKNGNYGELINLLKTLLRDNNVMVVNAALVAVDRLAAGLKEHFAPYHRPLFHLVVTHFKDKKTVAAVNSCLETFAAEVRLEDIADCVKEELADKSPAMRVHLCQWLEKVLVRGPSMATVKSAADSGLVTMLMRLSDEGIGEVRDAAYGCIGVLRSVAGESPVLLKSMGELGQQKLDRVNKAAESARFKWKLERTITLPEPMEDSKDAPRCQSIKNRRSRQSTSPFRRTKPLLSRQSLKLGESRTLAANQIKLTTLDQSSKMCDISDANDEDAGRKLSEETAEKQLAETIPAPLFTLIGSANWKERQKGLQDLRDWISKNSETAKLLSEALLSFLHYKLKGFKESNLSILKEEIALFQTIAGFHVKNKYLADFVVPEILDKIPDPKWAEACTSLVLTTTDSATPSYVLQKIVSKLNGNPKNQNIVKGALAIIGKIVEVYSIDAHMLKTVVESTKSHISNPSQPIRQAASSFFCQLYSVVGSDLKPMLGECKESSMKLLIANFDKVHIKSNDELRASKRSSDSTASPSRTNLAARLTTKIINGISDPSVKLRQEAKEQLDKIVNEAGGKIQAGSLGTLVATLKGRMTDPCKSLCRGFINLLGNIAASCGKEFKQYCKLILPPLMSNLADKQSYIRSETITTMNKLADAVGADTIITYCSALLEKDNPDMRLELLDWIAKHEEGLQRADCSTLVVPMVSCLQDRSKEVRTLAEKVVQLLLPLVGQEAFMSAMQDLKPVVIDRLKDVFKKILPPSAELAESLQNTARLIEREPMVVECEEKQIDPTIPKEDAGMEIVVAGGNDKTERAELDKRVKWAQDEPKEDYMERLNKQCSRAINAGVVKLMFSESQTDWVKAMEVFKAANNGGRSVVGVLDLVLKWTAAVVQSAGNNEGIAKCAIDFLTPLFESLAASKYQMMDFEAVAILQALAEQLGVCNAATKKQIKELIKISCSVYQPSKVWNILVRGLDSQNLLSKLECVSLLEEMTGKFGQKVVAARDIKAFGKFLSGIESSPSELNLKTQCLNLLAAIYKIKGEGIWTTLGSLPKATHDLLESKFKQIAATTTSPRTQTQRKNFSISLGSGSSASPKVRTSKEHPPLFALAPEAIQASAIDKSLRLLSEQNIDKKVEALVSLNGEIESSAAMAGQADRVLEELTGALDGLMEPKPEDIPVKFMKHFMTVLHKLCSSKQIVAEVSRETVEKGLDNLLRNLLREGIDKLGEQKEGESVMKLLNSSILRLLENCDPTKALCSLIQLLIKHKNDSESAKTPGLIVKCILKLTKIMNVILPNLNIDSLLLTIHEYLLATPPHPPFKQPHDEIGVKIVKTVVNELVKAKRESIWEHYKSVESHPQPDNDIKRWIAIILNTLGPSARLSAPTASPPLDPELKGIVEELKVKTQFPQAIMKIVAYKARHPSCDLGPYLQSCSPAFTSHVMSLINNHQALNKKASAGMRRYAKPQRR